MCGCVSCYTVVMENNSDVKDHEVENSFAMEHFDILKTVGTGEELIMNHVKHVVCRHICQSMHVSTQFYLQPHLPEYACFLTILFAGTFARVCMFLHNIFLYRHICQSMHVSTQTFI